MTAKRHALWRQVRIISRWAHGPAPLVAQILQVFILLDTCNREQTRARHPLAKSLELVTFTFYSIQHSVRYYPPDVRSLPREPHAATASPLDGNVAKLRLFNSAPLTVLISAFKLLTTSLSSSWSWLSPWPMVGVPVGL